MKKLLFSLLLCVHAQEQDAAPPKPPLRFSVKAEQSQDEWGGNVFVYAIRDNETGRSYIGLYANSVGVPLMEIPR
jgi:hypothetical protein